MKKPSSYVFHALELASFFTQIASSPTPATFTIGRAANTTSGNIHGHAAVNRTEVSEYLGIPFAQPPVGHLRFAAPEPYLSTASFNASKFGQSCMTDVTPANYSILTAEGYHLTPIATDYLNTIGESDGVAVGEDCLSLNVWTKPQTGEKAKAVLFFIHGGAFQGGSTNNELLNGQFLADEQDVVVISANYRLNVFGFPGLQPEVASMAPNAGLLDQRLAIEWARNNVAAFGGDPTRITLFGQSAGSVSISMYQYAYADDPIAHALITESGTVDNFGDSPANLTAAWLSLSGILGCDNSSTSATALASSVDCVRSKPAASLLEASMQVPIKMSVMGAFTPSVDDSTVFANYTALTASGRFAQLPRLLGSNAAEGGMFDLQAALAGIKLPAPFWEFYTLAIFTCPTASAAEGLAQYSPDQPVWRYMYDGDYPNLQLTTDPSLGAYHGAELSLVFDVSTAFGGQDTPAEASTGRAIRNAWAAFAKNPQSFVTQPPFDGLKLPSNSSRSTEVLHLGSANSTGAVFEPVGQTDVNCSLVMSTMEALGGPVVAELIAVEAIPLLQNITDGDISAVAKALIQAAQAAGI